MQTETTEKDFKVSAQPHCRGVVMQEESGTSYTIYSVRKVKEWLWGKKLSSREAVLYLVLAQCGNKNNNKIRAGGSVDANQKRLIIRPCCLVYIFQADTLSHFAKHIPLQ